MTLVDREALIESGRPLVRSIAKKVIATLPREVDREDVVRYGELGLVEAANKFDPTRGARFQTFAYYRIRGAIYDGLRQMAWLPRSLYAKLKYEEGANQFLLNASDRQIGADGKPDPAEQITQAVGTLAAIYVTSMDAAEGWEAEGTSRDDDPTFAAELKDTRKALCGALETLDEKERELLRLFYYENLTLTEAGERLGLSKSWASRLHSRALVRLQEALEERGIDAAPV